MSDSHGLRHLAIIMDGNRRWATERGLPKIEGHRAGIHAIERVVRGCIENDISYLTLYAFSTENWRRTESEISYLFDLMEDYLARLVRRGPSSELFANVNFSVRGNMKGMRPSIIRLAEKLSSRDPASRPLNAAIAVNYGSRAEIVEGVNKALGEGVRTFDEDMLDRYAGHRDYPDPDLLVRTSGVKRLSNFLLWQSAYSEVHFIDEKWPDLTERSIADFVAEYEGRDRRFGA